MIEKRFEVDVDHLLLVWDTEKNKRLEIEDIVDLLNNLHQENQQLKHYKLYEDNKRLQTIIADLKEENDALKKFIKDNFNEMMDSKMVIDV